MSFLESLKGQFWDQLFNIYRCDIFMLIDNIDITSYTDDTTPYVSGVILDSTVKSLEKVADLLFT